MDFSKYENTDPIPQPSDFSVVTRTMRQGLEKMGMVDQIAKDDANLAAYTQARSAHFERTRELEELFKRDALVEVGLEHHPNKDKIFDKAWDDGHAHGLQEVMANLEQLADLMEIKPTPIRHRIIDKLRAGRGGSFHSKTITSIATKLDRKELDVLEDLIGHFVEDARRSGERRGARDPGRHYRG
jgi:hypothetical protein